MEAQHITSTRKLVDSDEDHRILEEEIDRLKPPLPMDTEFQGFHYLLSTPFRYPPLQHGSRFGTRRERSLWYGSEQLSTVQAEVAYYRFLFLSGSSAVFDDSELRLTAFTVPVSSIAGIDLTAHPFSPFGSRISSKTLYTDSQDLGLEMRSAGVEVSRYYSARDREDGVNIALFTPNGFSSKNPLTSQTWICSSSSSRTEFSRSDLLSRETRVFDRGDFEVEGKLPAPAF